MFNLNDNEESILNELFEKREENICVTTEQDKKNIRKLVEENDTYVNTTRPVKRTYKNVNRTIYTNNPPSGHRPHPSGEYHPHHARTDVLTHQTQFHA